MRIVILITLGIYILSGCSQQKSWQEVTSVEDLNKLDTTLLPNMFEHFNLDHPGLEKVKEAKANGDLVQAGELLLDYFHSNSKGDSFRREQPTPGTQRIANADTILSDVFTIQNVKGKVPYLENGHRDWYYKGPNNDREWAWLSNRHSQVSEVLSAYFDTGNPEYIKYIDLFMKDFILASMPYPAEKGSESIWRGLEVAARAKIWTRLFYSTINNEHISPATRLLVLGSLPDHAHYNRNFHGQNNWLTMEISALATVAAYFPEYKKSNEWMDYTVDTMIESMKDQVYPDGVQTELTSHYHNVTFRNFELYQEICEVANQPLPEFFNQTIEDMYSYIAHAVRPSGYRILNNDGDKGSDVDLILVAAEKFNHPDWEYIATNGTSGVKPADGPSYFYPWAGQLISRSGFDKDAHWSFFDIGPWGSGHQHNDKLHLSVHAYGRDLLVDAGRFAYTGAVAEKFRPYARGSGGHNLILIDGKGQGPGPTHAKEALSDRYFKITPDFDYASNSFADFREIEGEASHTRSVFYVRGEFWVVVDRLETNKPREITTLWHWHPECEVETANGITKSVNKRGNLAVIPVGTQNFEVDLIEGQENPELQGWYSPEYNIYTTNVASSYQNTINGNTHQIWILYPSESEIPEVKANVLSENDRQVNVEVQAKGKSWKLVVPFIDASKAQLSTL